jgi:hypothetical protein
MCRQPQFVPADPDDLAESKDKSDCLDKEDAAMLRLMWNVVVGRIAASRRLARTWELGLALVIVVLGARLAFAGGACPCRRCACPATVGATTLCCPDDYCRKPMPCVPCPPCGSCCNDYCRKPMPCVPCPQGCWCPDDYCRKPMPCLCWPPSPVKYTCGR